MRHALLFVLAALASWAGGGLLLWTCVPGGSLHGVFPSRVVAALVLLGGVGGIYFLVRAMQGDTEEPEPGSFEALRAQAARRQTLIQVPSNYPMPVYAPITIPLPVYELSSLPGHQAPALSLAQLQGLLGQDGRLEAHEGPGDSLVLTGKEWSFEGETFGPLDRLWVKRGEAPEARPEDLTLESRNRMLVVACCQLLAAAYGPLRVRMRGKSEWIDVGQKPRRVWSLLAPVG